MKKHRIIFLGTPEFAVPTLEMLIANRQSPIAVITEPDRPAGRGKKLVASPVKIIAQKYKIPVFQPSKIENCKLKIENLRPDVAIVVAYGQIIPKEILEIPRFGFLNIHPSLLPKYRGPSPIQSAILNGDKETGITIIKLDEKMDHGPILVQQELEFPISNFQFPNKSKIQITQTDYQNLSKTLAQLGATLLIKTLPDYLEDKIKFHAQDHSKATYTKLINKSDGLINWNDSIKIIERKIRAYNPWPGAFTFLDGRRLKICQAHIDYDKLIIDRVQLEGKKEMTWQEFLRGWKSPIDFLDKLS